MFVFSFMVKTGTVYFFLRLLESIMKIKLVALSLCLFFPPLFSVQQNIEETYSIFFEVSNEELRAKHARHQNEEQAASTICNRNLGDARAKEINASSSAKQVQEQTASIRLDSEQGMASDNVTVYEIYKDRGNSEKQESKTCPCPAEFYNTPVESCEPLDPCLRQEGCLCRPFPDNELYLYGNWRGGERPCLDENLGTLGLMYADTLCYCNEEARVFSDLRWVNLECDNRYVLSYGVGSRFCLPSNVVLGVNAYYDYFDSSAGNFNQLGIGLELFSWRGLDIRANAYIPVGSISKTTTNFFNNYIGPFTVSCDETEWTSSGFDIEIGRCFGFFCDTRLYPALGGYYLDMLNFDDTFGVWGRLTMEWRHFLNMEVKVYHDDIFKTNTEFRIGFTIPIADLFRNGSRFCGTKDPIVRRRDYICTSRCCKYTTNY